VSAPLAYPALAVLALAGCAAEAQVGQAGQQAAAPVYRGIDTQLLEGDLVAFTVEMQGARGTDDVRRYAECAAAQYALIRGGGFARHVRTNVSERGGVWRGDAVYTISSALPDGLRTIDAEVTVQACAAERIPTV